MWGLNWLVTCSARGRYYAVPLVHCIGKKSRGIMHGTETSSITHDSVKLPLVLYFPLCPCYSEHNKENMSIVTFMIQFKQIVTPSWPYQTLIFCLIWNDNDRLYTSTNYRYLSHHKVLLPFIRRICSVIHYKAWQNNSSLSSNLNYVSIIFVHPSQIMFNIVSAGITTFYS